VIVSSQIQDGDVFSPAPQDVTEVVTFSEPMNVAAFDPAALDLFGQFRNVHYAASATTWDPTGTVLTIQYNNLPSDAYQFNLSTFGFQDLAGNFLASGLTVNFFVTAGTSDLTGLTPILPVGSLVDQEAADKVLVDASDVNTYNLGIDPQQTIAVLVTPVTSSMTATVTLLDPNGNVVGTATSPSPGAPALIPGVQSPNGGVYQIVVSG